jgi:hypothetical protein
MMRVAAGPGTAASISEGHAEKPSADVEGLTTSSTEESAVAPPKPAPKLNGAATNGNAQGT